MSDRALRILSLAGVAIASLVLAILIALLSIRFFPGDEAPRAGGDNPPIREAPLGGPYSLVSETGETVTQASFAGDYTLMYFGFTFCPDICPTELQVMSTAYDMLPADVAAAVQPMFITIDPNRDTVEAVREYTALFHEELIGLTGSAEQIAAVAREFRVFYQAVGQDEDPDYYTVDHSSFIYLQGPDNENVAVFPYGTPPETIAETIEDAVAGNPA